MNSILNRSFWERMISSKGRRSTQVLLLFVVIFAALEISQCFVPYVLKTPTCVLPIKKNPSFRLQQQLTQIDLIRKNEGEAEIAKTNNTESFGTLQPKQNGVDSVSEIFPHPSSLKISKEIIESTVDDVLKSSGRSMGLLGETRIEESDICSVKRGSALAVSYKSSSTVVASVATAMDDLEIATLRLSVFSNFNPESRKLFCERSCQLLSSRRRRGATCVIASMKTRSEEERNPETTNSGMRRKEYEPIVGTAEVSFHEFSGTQLSRSRPKYSILYVTEVAVDAKERRNGIAKLLMEAIDILAITRKIETMYLHVDVTNLGAVRLYEKVGYKKLEPNNPMFLEFTTKLNLHDGATRGRNHYLMSKDLRQATWFDTSDGQLVGEEGTLKSRQRTIGIDVLSSL